jgi:NhaP-type Na+/H+ or K+/H+ antiporter
MSEIGEVQVVFLLLLFFVVVFGLLARKLGTPYPIVMVIGGLLLGFVPGVPNITLNPDLVFLAVLPPLLYAAAWTTSWRDFRYNLVSIFLLAFGLVGFTIAAVALIAPSVFEHFDWRLGFVIGAVVWSVWGSLNFVLNGLVFVLFGLQLPTIRASIRGYGLSTLVVDGAVFSVLLILLRLVWVFPGAGVSWLVRNRLLHQTERRPPARQIFVLG